MLNFKVQGEGKSIVYLHGFMESISMWNYLDLKQIPAQHIFIDLPGHGLADLTDSSDEPSLQFMVDQVLEVLTYLGVKSYCVVGHSMGGYVGLILKQEDKRCEKLVLLNSNFWDDNEQKKKDRVRVADLVFKAKKLFIQEAIPNLFGRPENFQKEIILLIQDAIKMLPESIAYSSLAMRNRKDFSVEINSNSSDYYFIHGKLDRLIETEYIESKLDNCDNLYLIEEAGHMAHIEQSIKVLSILKNILN